MALDAATASALQNIVDTINRQTAELSRSFQSLPGDTNTPGGGRTANNFKKSADSFVQYAADLRRERKALTQEMNSYMKNADGLTQASNQLLNLSTLSEDYKKVLEKVKKEYKELDLDSLNEATREQIETMMTYAEQTDATTVDLMRLSQRLREAGLEQQANGLETRAVRKQNTGLGKAMGDLRERTASSVKGFLSMDKGIALLTASIIRAMQSIEQTAKRQVPMMDATAGSWENWTARFGLSSTKFQETVDENTQMMLANASAGSDLRSAAGQYLHAFEGMRDSAYQLTGDYDDASNLVTATMDTLSQQGADLNFDSIQGPANTLMKSLTSLAKVTNRSATETAAALKVAMKDNGVRKAMLQLSQKERIDMINSMAQDQLLLINKGMEADAALEAVKALKGVAGMDPKERLKEAAKMAAAAGAMGVGGGQDMIQLAMKPMKAWTEKDKERAQQFATDMENAVAQGMGSENFGQQLTTFAVDSMSSGPFKDAIMGMSTAGMEGTAVAEKTFEATKESNTLLVGVQKLLFDIKAFGDRILAVVKDLGAGIIAGIGLVVGGALATIFSPVIGIIGGIAAIIATIAAFMADWGNIGEGISDWWNNVDLNPFDNNEQAKPVADKMEEAEQTRKDQEAQRQKREQEQAQKADDANKTMEQQLQELRNLSESFQQSVAEQKAARKAAEEHVDTSKKQLKVQEKTEKREQLRGSGNAMQTATSSAT